MYIIQFPFWVESEKTIKEEKEYHRQGQGEHHHQNRLITFPYHGHQLSIQNIWMVNS